MTNSITNCLPPKKITTQRSSVTNLQLVIDLEETKVAKPSISEAQTVAVVPVASPFIKWAGGKRRLLSAILGAAPKQFDRYLEPFVGGGAVALALSHPHMLLNDANQELIYSYQAVRDNVEDLIVLLNGHRGQHNESYYYQVRAQDVSTLSPLHQAARLIYLNKTCFNGLYRVNRNGDFNVPYGGHDQPNLYDECSIRRASEALHHAHLFTGDYRAFLEEHARPGDFIYLDPPYVPIGKFSDFKRYTKDQFRGHNQEDLARLYSDLVRRGCYPVLSNSWTARDLYSEHDVIEVRAARNISKDGAGRQAVPEILVRPKQPT